MVAVEYWPNRSEKTNEKCEKTASSSLLLYEGATLNAVVEKTGLGDIGHSIINAFLLPFLHA